MMIVMIVSWFYNFDDRWLLVNVLDPRYFVMIVLMLWCVSDALMLRVMRVSVRRTIRFDDNRWFYQTSVIIWHVMIRGRVYQGRTVRLIMRFLDDDLGLSQGIATMTQAVTRNVSVAVNLSLKFFFL